MPFDRRGLFRRAAAISAGAIAAKIPKEEVTGGFTPRTEVTQIEPARFEEPEVHPGPPLHAENYDPMRMGWDTDQGFLPLEAIRPGEGARVYVLGNHPPGIRESLGFGTVDIEYEREVDFGYRGRYDPFGGMAYRWDERPRIGPWRGHYSTEVYHPRSEALAALLPSPHACRVLLEYRGYLFSGTIEQMVETVGGEPIIQFSGDIIWFRKLTDDERATGVYAWERSPAGVAYEAGRGIGWGFAQGIREGVHMLTYQRSPDDDLLTALAGPGDIPALGPGEDA